MCCVRVCTCVRNVRLFSLFTFLLLASLACGTNSKKVGRGRVVSLVATAFPSPVLSLYPALPRFLFEFLHFYF